MQHKVRYGCFGLALALAAAAGLRADSGFGFRVAGGYGFGLNTDSGLQVATLAEGSGGSALPLSTGIPAQVELLYRVLPQFQVGFGVFPVFGTNESADINVEGTPLTETLENVDAYPVLLSAYFDQPLGRGFSAFAGLGFGVVPSGSFDFDFSSGGETITVAEDLNAGFAARGVLGVDYALNPYVKAGLQVQDLVFDRAVYSEQLQLGDESEGFGWTGETYDYNQVAPMLFVEADF